MSSSSNRTYYDILGVDATASKSDIRKSYLKLSLKYHPDKNPAEQQEECKLKFIEIGQAYDVLYDDDKRRAYDLECRGNRYTGRQQYSSSSSEPSSVYESYANAFEEHMAGMSEAEIAAVIGTAAVVGSMVGGFVINQLTNNKGSSARGSGGSSSLLATAGSLFKNIHQSSIENVVYRQQCNDAIARGEPIPERSNNDRQRNGNHEEESNPFGTFFQVAETILNNLSVKK